MMKSVQRRASGWYFRLTTAAAAGALLVVAAAASPVAAASPTAASDVFMGKAIIAPGQTSPVQVDPSDISMRADGAIGIGYHYVALGRAGGQLPGVFRYDEHGYLYFKNPADPSTMVGSRFASGVFTLTPDRGGAPIVVADTAPDSYTSGVQTISGYAGNLSFGYFTFTNDRGTFKGYATPDFTQFIIQIAFDQP